jgi:hypothetical protein
VFVHRIAARWNAQLVPRHDAIICSCTEKSRERALTQGA